MKKHKKLALSVLNCIDIYEADFYRGGCLSITCVPNDKNLALLSVLDEYVGKRLTYDSDALGPEGKKLIEISELAFTIANEFDGKNFNC